MKTTDVTETENANPETHPLDDCFGLMSERDAAQLEQIIEAEFERIDDDAWL